MLSILISFQHFLLSFVRHCDVYGHPSLFSVDYRTHQACQQTPSPSYPDTPHSDDSHSTTYTDLRCSNIHTKFLVNHEVALSCSGNKTAALPVFWRRPGEPGDTQHSKLFQSFSIKIQLILTCRLSSHPYNLASYHPPLLLTTLSPHRPSAVGQNPFSAPSMIIYYHPSISLWAHSRACSSISLFTPAKITQLLGKPRTLGYFGFW